MATLRETVVSTSNIREKAISFSLLDFLISLLLALFASCYLAFSIYSDEVNAYGGWRSLEAVVVSGKIEKLAGGRGVPNVLTLKVMLVGGSCLNKCDLEILQSLSSDQIKFAKELTPGKLIRIWVNSDDGIRIFRPGPPRFWVVFSLVFAVVGSLIFLLVFFTLTHMRSDEK